MQISSVIFDANKYLHITLFYDPILFCLQKF